MRILMLTDRMDIGGAQTHIATLCRALHAKGHDITLLSAGGCFADQLGKDGIHTATWPSDKRHPLAVLRCAARLRRLVKDSAFDILHAHTRFTATLATRLLGKRCTVVSTAHLPFSTTRAQRRLMRWGRHTLAVSEDIKDYLIHTYGLTESEITKTVNGIDTDIFYEVSHDSLTVVHTSRLDPDRAAAALALCEIAPELLRRFPDAHVHIVGSGAWYDRVRALAKKANHRIGYDGVTVSQGVADLSGILQEGGVFVGVSRAALEAMSTGLPVILAGNEGYAGILDEDTVAVAARTNFCARDFPAIENEHLLNDLCTLLGDRERRTKLSDVGVKAVHASFLASHMAEDALRAYRCALTPKSAFLIGYYGYGNLGDELSLTLIKSAFLKRNVYNFHVFSKENSEDGMHIKRTNIFKILWFLRKSDVVLFGGGNLLQNETSRRSFLLYGFLLRYAHAHRRRIVMVSTGIGAVKGERARRTLSRLLSLSSGVFLRTADDAVEATALLADAPSKPYIEKTQDICFTLNKGAVTSRGRRVLFILHSVKNKEELFSLQATVEQLRGAGLEVAFAVVYPEQDHALSFALARLFEAPVFTADTWLSFSAHAASSCLIISDRLHGAILSLLCHTPCYLCAEPIKNRRLIRDVVKCAHTAALPSPLLGFWGLSALKGRLCLAKRLHAVHSRLYHRLRAASASAAFLHTVSFARPDRKKEVGGAQASDFERILRSLRAGASWESFVFYENML